MKIANQLEENAVALMDLRVFTIAQNNEIFNSDLTKIMPKVKYVANVMGSSPVGNLQVRRISDEKKMKIEVSFFDNKDDAVKWLDLRQGS